jgi:hypothetical protein
MRSRALFLVGTLSAVGLLAVCAPAGMASPKPLELTITGFAAEPVPPEIRPSYWADDGRYITMGSATWTGRPRAAYFFCLRNLTAPYGPRGYHREGCISVAGNHYEWTFDPYTFPNNVGGVDGGFYYGESIAFYVLAFYAPPPHAPSLMSNIVYESIY